MENKTKAPAKKSVVRSFFNLPQHICCHLFGENHPVRHRIVVGLVMCFAGVATAIIASEVSHSLAVKICSDTLGFSLHGIGIAPAIERMAKK